MFHKKLVFVPTCIVALGVSNLTQADNSFNLKNWPNDKELPSQTYIPGQYFLSFKDHKSAQKFVLPVTCKKSQSYRRWVSINCESKNSDETFEFFRNQKEIIAINKIEKSYPQQWGHSFPQNPYMEKEVATNGLNDRGQCAYNETCADGRAKFWAQQRVNGDLMFEFLKNERISTGTVNVAVVDSGFDESKNKEHMASPKFSVHQGHAKAGSPTEDQSGHGTAVSGLIGGKNGVGLAPNANLRVYRVTEPGGSGSAKSDYIKMSIAKACDDGASIINVSWGEAFDEKGIFEEEKSFSDFYAEMLKRGCLIIKSAGNSAKRVDRNYMDPDDALLRVEASEISGNISSFSSNGELRAPGSGVFTHRSSQVSSSSYNNFCGKNPGTFVSGTSFASPITAAIAAQVQAVLKKKNPKFEKISGRDRIRWTTRILRASSISGNLDANRAVRMAAMDMAPLIDLQPVPSEEQLKNAFDESNKAFCSAVNSQCLAAATCSDNKSCMSHQRLRISLCHPVSDAEMLKTLALADRVNANDLAAGFLKNVDSDKDLKKLNAIASDLWSKLYKTWESKNRSRQTQPQIPFDQAIEILPILVQRRVTHGLSHDPTRALREFLQSNETFVRLSRGKASNSQADVAKVAMLVQNYQKTFGVENANKILQEAMEAWASKDSAESSRGIVAGSRLWAQLKTLNDGQDKHSDLAQYLLSKAKTLPVSSLPEEDEYLDELLSTEHSASPLFSSTDATNRPLNLVDWHRIKNYQKLIPEKSRYEFFYSILLRFDSERGSAWSEGAVVRDAFLAMHEDSKLHPENYSLQVIDRYWNSIISKESPNLWARVLPLNILNQVMPKIEGSPIINSPRAKEWARRVFDAAISDQKNFRNHSDITSNILVASRKLLTKEERAPLQEKLIIQECQKLSKLEKVNDRFTESLNYLNAFLYDTEIALEVVATPRTLETLQETTATLKASKDSELRVYGVKFENQLKEISLRKMSASK